jgi:ATP-binding cassette, subfamily B, multidrug efflux pump
MKDLLSLLPYLKKYRAGIALGMVFVVITNAFATVTPWILGRTVDVIGWMIGMEYVIPLILLFMLIVTLEGIARYYMRRVLIGISRELEYDIRNNLFAKVQTYSQEVFNRIRTGEIMSRATNDISNVRMVLGPGIMYSFTTVTMLVFVLTVMFSISWFLTLLALVPLPILTVVILRISRRLHQRYSKVQEDLAELTTVVQENISGIRVVKGHCREDSEIDNFIGRSDSLRGSNLAAARLYAGFRPFMMIIAGASTVIILYFGGRMVIEGAITLGDLVAFFAYLGLLIWPMTSLGWVINMFQRGAASMGRINGLMAVEPQITDPPAPRKIETVDGAVTFRNINFRYSEDGPLVLKDINLEVAPGRTIAVVGPTGAGKSTLLRLVPRLWDPEAGAVLLDGGDVRDLDLRNLRRHIGYVPQETFLFSETVAENIAFGAGDGETNRDAVTRAAEVSKLSNDVQEFKHGYDTLLGERGINMSGGQKQRTAIARALAGNPRILLLDDCLSAVDTNTEREILEGLRRELEGRTALIVSHRMSSIMDADLIVVMQEGRITERGSHAELLERDGVYADLFHKQQLTEALEELEQRAQ